MVRVQRVNGRLVPAPKQNQTRLQQSLQTRLQQQQVQQQQQKEIQAEAQRIDSLLKQNNFGGSVEEFNKQFNSIKQQNPELANALSVNPQTIQNEIDSRITKLQERKSRSKSKESKARKKGDKVRARGEDAFQKGIDIAIDELKKGKLITVDDAQSFARQLETQAQKGAKLKARELKKKVAKLEVPKTVDVKKGERVQAVGQGTGLITITDTKKGTTTQTLVNLDTGKDISRTTFKTPKKATQKVIDNFKKDLNKKVLADLKPFNVETKISALNPQQQKDLLPD